MDDLISRQAIMKVFADFVRRSNNSDFARTPTWNDAVSLVESMPSAHRPVDEWCTDCSEYDKERHCCPRFNRVIRTAFDDSNTDKGIALGKWIKEQNCMFRCSICKDHYPSIRGYMSYKYCPNCGARMDGDENG